ncbi:MAG: flagellar export protein FliJ [Planctomycetaceae bacterium]
MKSFHFKLAALLELRGHRRDCCRQSLRALVLEADQLNACHHELERRRLDELEALRCLGRRGAVDLAASSFRRRYVQQMAEAIARLDQEREAAFRRVEAAREELTSAEQALASLEKLEARNRAEHDLTEQQREARELADLVLCRTLASAHSARPFAA